MKPLELIATTTFGLEAVVARELKELGYPEQSTADGRVTFTGDPAAICRTNLWLRSAERVLLKVGEFDAADFGELFDRTRQLPWAELIGRHDAFPVRGRSVRSQLHSVPDCQAIVKKAIVESMKARYAVDWFEETGASYAVEVSILKDRVTLAVDTSGPGLHKRGYRKLSGKSPLKETLAAALVQLSFWNPERPFADPFCGTGTIPIEAALIARRRAPGLNRAFAAEGWPLTGQQLWSAARDEARDLERPPASAPMLATDIDGDVLSLARYHAQQAGVAEEIHFQQKPFESFSSRREYGVLIANPPYGERLGDQASVTPVYRGMRRVFDSLPTWSFYVLTAFPDFERVIDRPADRRRKLFNGGIECTYYQYYGPRPTWSFRRET